MGPFLPGPGLRALACVLALAAAACGGRSPTQPSGGSPSPSVSDLSGAWTGDARDPSGSGTMAWQASQSGAVLSGTITLTDQATSVTGRGTLAGEVSGASVRFSGFIPVGGFDGRFNACSANLSGEATLSGNSLRGTYAGSNTCSGPFTSGQFTMSRP